VKCRAGGNSLADDLSARALILSVKSISAGSVGFGLIIEIPLPDLLKIWCRIEGRAIDCTKKA